MHIILSCGYIFHHAHGPCFDLMFNDFDNTTYTIFKGGEPIFSFNCWICRNRPVVNYCGALLTKIVFKQILFFHEISNKLVTN